MAPPLVSIITPTYNHEKFIGQCVESVLAQTYPHWEQIIIDDGSTDNTGEVVSYYRDRRIKYIRQENVGIWRLADTYNKALNMSQGEFIAILEGDDFWTARKLEKQLPSFSEPEVVLSFGKTISINSRGETILIYPKNFKWFYNKTKLEIISRLFQENILPANTVMCRKQALLKIGGFKQPPDVPYVDYPTWLELSFTGKLQPVEDVLGYWRRHENQATATMVLALTEASKFAINFYDNLDEKTKEILPVSRDLLLKFYQRRVSAANFHLGRVALLNSNWHEAKIYFEKALHNGVPLLKIKALLGLLCSYCKINMEWAALMTFRRRLKDMF